MAKIIGNTTATPNPRPDWNQNDESKADYVKNRPFYKEEKVTDYIEIVSKGQGIHSYGQPIGLVVGTDYIVDVVDYHGTISTDTVTAVDVHDDGSHRAVGLIGGYFDGKVLEIIDNYDTNEVTCGMSSDMYIIRIYGIKNIQTIYHPIPQEYLNLPNMSSVLIVNVTIAEDGTVSADKTYNDIFMAHSEGKVVQCYNAEREVVGIMSACGSIQAVFIFQTNDGTAMLHCSSANVWTLELYELEYAQKSYVDNAIQEAIIDSWSEVTAPNGMAINETEVSE